MADTYQCVSICLFMVGHLGIWFTESFNLLVVVLDHSGCDHSDCIGDQ